jgi:integrase
MRQGVKLATLARELEVLRHALNLAVREWEWLDRNPFERVKIEKPDNAVERWLTEDEEARLLAASPPWLAELIVFALNTGTRQAEMLTLRASEVNLARRTITLLHTKNKRVRTIPINQTVCELLGRKQKVRSISGYVFTSLTGGPIDAANLIRAFRKVRERTGLNDVRWHDLRHTFATRLVQAGVTLYVVKELLGHTTLTMTMRYAHHDPESLRHGVDVLEKRNHVLITLDKKRASGESPRPSSALVAGSGFEPEAFGL